MVVGSGLVTILLAGGASAFMAWSIGAGSSGSTPFAPAVGADGSSATALVGTTVGLALVVGGLLFWRVSRDPTVANREFLLAMGALVAFSAGGTQVGLALGPLLPLLAPFDLPLTVVLVGGGLGLLAGSWTGAPRMIKALSQDYASLDPELSVAALIPSFAIAQVAVLYGIPVSFNEIVVSAIVGAGLAGGGSGVSREKAVRTVGAWLGSLALAFGLGYVSFPLVAAVLG